MAADVYSASPDALVPPFTEVPPAAISRVLSRFDREQLAGFVAVAIDLMDLADPDPDLEDATDLEDDFALSPQAIGYSTGPGCEIGDGRGDQAYVEWTSHRAARSSPACILAGQEDDEQDDCDHGIEDDPQGFDPEEDMCLAGDDRIGSGSLTGAMLLCEDTGPGDADDAEREQMQNDVPVLSVCSLDYNLFTDQRVSLGLSNLLTSFRTNGGEVVSADTGRTLRTVHGVGRVPAGAPV